MMFILSIFGIATVSSFAGGLVGLGGGFVLVPLLTLQLRMPIHTAIFFSLISLFWMSLLKVLQNRDLVEKQRKLILKLGWMSILGSALSALIASRTPAATLNLIFSIVLIVIAIYFYLDRNWEGSGEVHKHGLLWTRLVFFASGMMGGLLGLGGGLFNIPALHKLLKLPMNIATKINFPFIFISASTALIVFFQTDADKIRQLPLPPVFAMLVGTTLGSYASGRVKISSKNLKLLFALLLIILGVAKIYKTLA